MKVYEAITWAGDTKRFSAYTYSDAYEKAYDWAGSELKEFYES